MMSKPLCIWHKGCLDGFAAAWVVRKFFGDGNVDFFAGVYQADPPDVTGRDVIMVDFSYKRPILDEMAKACAAMLILDHHKSAAEDLSHLPPPAFNYPPIPPVAKVTAIFDMNRSGATITWDAFFAGQPRPRLIDHIQDRDLWLFKLEGTREINAALFSYPFEFETWDRMMADDMTNMTIEGMAIDRQHLKDVASLVKSASRTLMIGGYAVPGLNAPYMMASDAGNQMAQGERFAATYQDFPDGRVFSLRSAEDGIDVSEIAKQYGGGGHKHAAGFKVPLLRIGEFEKP